MMVEAQHFVGGRTESFRVDPGQEATRIDKFLAQKIRAATRSRIQRMIKEGLVTVGGRLVTARYKLRPLDVVVMQFPSSPRPDHVVSENLPIEVVYEDEHLLVVNKAADMVVHPAHENWTGTLLNALAYRFAAAGAWEGDIPPERLGLIHRIDKGTSGLLVVGKTEEAVQKISRQFLVHSVERAYYALVWGVPKRDHGVVQEHLARNPKDRREMITVEKYKGKHAITHYKVLQAFGTLSLLECRLETGRTHQIRAHMRHIGHPIFNDERYGGDRVHKGRLTAKYKQFIKNCMGILPRQALHAKTLGFIHPGTGRRVFFDSVLPADMQGVIDKCATYVRTADG